METLLSKEITYDAFTIIYNLLLSCILGIIISTIYKVTHKGLSYSQSFMLTIVFVTVVVCMVMMVIGNNLARAFALVGALSIIRFRTVIKDTKDTSYVFFGLAAGMAAGTSSYFLAIIGVIIISVLSIILYKTNYGSIYKSEIILRFRAVSGLDSKSYNKIINKYSLSSNILHVEPSSDTKESNTITFDLVLKKNINLEDIASDLKKISGLSEIKLIASKTDVDY